MQSNVPNSDIMCTGEWIRNSAQRLRHSGTARVVEGFDSFTCTPTRSSTNVFTFPAEADPHLPTPEVWKAQDNRSVGAMSVKMQPLGP